ncbi:MAG: TRAP transporter large permease subunit, partial [Prolixibacteraceae bacterium]|nr:TRAP transporter large permease subunit [Prolixibacteraceae bacterium]
TAYSLLFFVNIFLLLNGCWLSDTAQLVLFAPLFTPILMRLGIHPVHFGVVMVVNTMIGMITPPYGMALYLASSIADEPLKKVVKMTLPFTLVSIIVLFIVTYFPVLILYLPQLFEMI